MIQQGEIYDYSDPAIPPHPVIVISREELNRGDRVVAAIITSAKFSVRSKLANCVVLKAGQFGMTKDCVVQGEGGILVLELEHVNEFAHRCPEQFAAIVDTVAFVKWRRMETGGSAVLALSYDKSG